LGEGVVKKKCEDPLKTCLCEINPLYKGVVIGDLFEE